MSCFFDTNVLVYVFDRAEPAKQALAQELVTEHMSARDMVLSTQVLQELYVTLTRKKRLGTADALEVVTTFAQERVVPASADTVLRGLALSQRHQLSAWDALILQAALDAGCTTLFSEDFQAGARFDDLVVVNPFAPQVQAPRAAYGKRR
ncbi:MAG TPA: PIN domain-containing protein [Burkholderiaceae bacterium]|nr:PIN domain-containing protein [Burkholderiaceae bacterium]